MTVLSRRGIFSKRRKNDACRHLTPSVVYMTFRRRVRQRGILKTNYFKSTKFPLFGFDTNRKSLFVKMYVYLREQLTRGHTFSRLKRSRAQQTFFFPLKEIVYSCDVFLLVYQLRSGCYLASHLQICNYYLKRPVLIWQYFLHTAYKHCVAVLKNFFRAKKNVVQFIQLQIRLCFERTLLFVARS